MSSLHTRMEPRVFHKLAPDVNAAITALAKTTEESGLEHELLELIKLRASQINGCAFCVQYHLNDARKLGVPAEKLDLVVAWHEAGIFSAREQAALAWTDALTNLPTRGAPDDVYALLTANFSEKEIAYLTTAIATINVWNRIAVSFRYPPPIPKAA